MKVGTEGFLSAVSLRLFLATTAVTSVKKH